MGSHGSHHRTRSARRRALGHLGLGNRATLLAGRRQPRRHRLPRHSLAEEPGRRDYHHAVPGRLRPVALLRRHHGGQRSDLLLPGVSGRRLFNRRVRLCRSRGQAAREVCGPGYPRRQARPVDDLVHEVPLSGPRAAVRQRWPSHDVGRRRPQRGPHLPDVPPDQQRRVVDGRGRRGDRSACSLIDAGVDPDLDRHDDDV